MPRTKGLLLRSVADSNRRTWFCRPLPSHSANRPLFGLQKYNFFPNTQTPVTFLNQKRKISHYLLKVTLTLSILPPIGGFILDTFTEAFFMVLK